MTILPIIRVVTTNLMYKAATCVLKSPACPGLQGSSP
jgi:hypothetical protein